MLDIPYTTIQENRLDYEIFLLRNQQGKTFKEIARLLQRSANCIRVRYNRVRYKQLCLYIRHIAVALGMENLQEIREEAAQAEEWYGNRTYALAYLEKKYASILDAYRGGEPALPPEIADSLPPIRDELKDEEIERIRRMRDEEKAPFAIIAQELCITPEKAETAYQFYYHQMTRKLERELREKAQTPEEKKAVWNFCFRTRESSARHYRDLKEALENSGEKEPWNRETEK